MLFADLAGFSPLPIGRYPAFHEAMNRVALSVLRSTRVRPRYRNSWGDGLLFVFDAPAAAACMALGLLDGVGRLDRTGLGRPAPAHLRVALHWGEVYRWFDPLLGRPAYVGGGLTLAARIEPVTPPGCAYTSEPFARRLAAPDGAYSCSCLGARPLAKG